MRALLNIRTVERSTRFDFGYPLHQNIGASSKSRFQFIGDKVIVDGVSRWIAHSVNVVCIRHR